MNGDIIMPWRPRRESPLTVQQLGVLRSLGALVIEPVEKNLACGDMGEGRGRETHPVLSWCP